jgi:hypothetical protein
MIATRTSQGAALVLAAAALFAGCGSSSSNSSTAVNPNQADVSPAGDIPDNQAYVPYRPPGGGFTVKVPEGWSRSARGGAVTFTDKLNAIRMERGKAARPLTPAATRRTEVPKLAKTVPGFQTAKIDTVTRPAGRAVRISYLAAATRNPVTGRRGQDAVERYVFFRHGREVILTLSGPKGADNVDPWRIVSSSLRWSG